MSQTLSIAPKRIIKREATQRLRVSFHVVNHMIATGELKTAPRIGNAKAIILESSVDELVARISGNDGQAE